MQLGTVSDRFLTIFTFGICNKTHVIDRIPKLTPIHVSLILQIPEYTDLSFHLVKLHCFEPLLTSFLGFKVKVLSRCLHASPPANKEFYRFPLWCDVCQPHGNLLSPIPFTQLLFQAILGVELASECTYIRSIDARLQLDLLKKCNLFECLKDPVTLTATDIN